MANQKLSDKDYHLDPVNSDFIHSVDVSDTTDSTEGTSKKLTWATIKDTLFSFLKLRDVNDSTYVGKTGFVPAVTYNSLGVPELKLTTLPTYTDLLGGNAIIKGGVIYTGSGLNYTIYASKYIINNQVYTDYVSDTVTLSDGDATNSRIDVFAVEITTDDPPVASIVVVEGTPAVSPIKPSLNLSTQVEVSFKLVLDNETTDPDFTAELIYNENLGETNEWDNILLATSANLNYTTAPYSGTYSLYLPATTSGTTKWQKDAMFAHDAEGSLNFAMKFPEAVETNPKIELELINSSSSKYFRFVLTFETLRDYGFDVTSNAWQLIRVPLNEFVSDSRVPPTEYDILSIKTVNSPIINLDVINITGGVANPTNAQSVLEVVAGTNVTVDSSDPLRPIVSATNLVLEGYSETGTQAADDLIVKLGGYLNSASTHITIDDVADEIEITGYTPIKWTSGGGFGATEINNTYMKIGSFGGGTTPSVGSGSMVWGLHDTSGNADGNSSISFGRNTTATGSQTQAFGFSTVASGTNSFASGSGNTSSGNNSFSANYNNEAPSFCEFRAGLFSTAYTPTSTTAFDATDRLFVVGNGTGTGTRNDALIILKNGNATFDTTIATGGYTVATLPTGVVGMRAYVTDATAPTYNGTLTGGGAITVPVFYNGSAWVSA